MPRRRRTNSSKEDLEETRFLLEQSDRSRRAAEQDLFDTNKELAKATNLKESLTGSKRRNQQEFNQMNISLLWFQWILTDLVNVQADLNKMVAEAGISKEKAQRAMIDSARQADKLRMEQYVAKRGWPAGEGFKKCLC